MIGDERMDAIKGRIALLPGVEQQWLKDIKWLVAENENQARGIEELEGWIARANQMKERAEKAEQALYHLRTFGYEQKDDAADFPRVDGQ